MKLLNNWNPINTIENLVYVAATFLFMNYMIVQPLNNRIDRLEGHLVVIAMKDTYSISNDFEKMRTKKGGSIVLDLNNDLTHNELDLMPMDSLVADSVTTEKKGFFKRLFSGK